MNKKKKKYRGNQTRTTTTTNSSRKVIKTKRKRMSGGLMPALVSGRKRKKRKKVGATITGNKFMDAVLGVGGGVVASLAYNKMVPMENRKMKNGILAGAGAGALFFGAKQKNMLLGGIGAGMLSVGGLQLAQDFGVLQGLTDPLAEMGLIEEDEDVMYIEMQGTGLPEQDPMNGYNAARVPIVSGVGYQGQADVMGGTGMPSVISGS